MRSSQLFWRMFLAYAGLVLLGIIASTAWISSWEEDQLIFQANRRLKDVGMLLRENVASRLPQEPTYELQTQIHELSKALDMRLTIIGEEGIVLADSAQPTVEAVRKMENHQSRTEVVRARKSGEATTQRNSPSLGDAYFYYAIAIKRDSQYAGVVRTALPTSVVQQQLSVIRQLVWSIGVILALLGLATTYWLTKRLVSPINVLTDAAEGIAAGKYAQRIRLNTNDEFGMLARSFERMSTELGSRETQLRESVQHQTTVLGGMVEGVIAVDRDQHVLFANVAAGTKLGFAPDRVEGLPLLEVVRSHELREIVQQALETSETVRGEIAWQARKKMLALDVQATPLAGNPPPGVVLVLHDITELKRLEGLRQQFVANVSHELKTPLSSIKAYTETLLNGALEDPQHARHFLTRIDDQASRLHELILDLLSLARIESGQAALEITNLPIRKVVEACLADHEERGRSGGLTIENLVTESTLMVRADEEALLQILGNLIDNAIKYTPTGGSITIRCREEADEAVIEVADTGVGIEPEHHGRLFERFYRVDKARSRELGGTGLGLAIVKHLCQAMQGTVSVQSEPGRGSIFGVRLPLARNSA
jgi:two-component system, OmpR family, phosphate regulon sensor histidine kinase PhoR